MAPQMILRSTSATLGVTFYIDGAPTSADAPPTVTVLGGSGATVATGTATLAGTGSYTYVLAPQTSLNSLTVNWTGAFSAVTQTLTTYAEVVGGHLFSEAQARAFASGVMANTTAYPSAVITDTRAQITDALETYTGQAWIPRYKRRTMRTTGTDTLNVPERRVTRVISATNSGTALSAPELAALVIDEEQGLIMRQGGAAWYTSGLSPRPLVLEYEYGYDRPVDGVDRIALKWLRRLLVASDIYETASSYSTDLGTFTTAPFLPSGDRVVDMWVRSHTIGVY